MEADERRAKKRAEANRLRDISPAESITMGFQLMQFARDLAEAADRAER